MSLRVVTAILFFVVSFTAGASAADVRAAYSPAQYLKNFALSVCISEGYKSDEVVNDSRAAAGGYLELGSFPFEAYEDVATLGRTFLAKEYRGVSGQHLTLMKCIDFFHSQELDQLTKRYIKK
ncbi:MAG TPA: T6SS amidase immunity protein Tai4 family protein [Xanthobacteraceae bacterium]|jgi:hypothetical protein